MVEFEPFMDGLALWFEATLNKESIDLFKLSLLEYQMHHYLEQMTLLFDSICRNTDKLDYVEDVFETRYQISKLILRAGRVSPIGLEIFNQRWATFLYKLKPEHKGAWFWVKSQFKKLNVE